MFFHGDGSPKSVREVYDWAMQQPGAADTPVRVAEPAAETALYQAADASSANIESLLASVMNWQPGGDFYAPSQGPSSPLMLTPGLLDVLSKS